MILLLALDIDSVISQFSRLAVNLLNVTMPFELIWVIYINKCIHMCMDNKKNAFVQLSHSRHFLTIRKLSNTLKVDTKVGSETFTLKCCGCHLRVAMTRFLIYFSLPVQMSPRLLSRIWPFWLADFYYLFFPSSFGLYGKMLLGGRKIFTM